MIPGAKTSGVFPGGVRPKYGPSGGVSAIVLQVVIKRMTNKIVLK
jgi:hypothetical protein